MSKAATFATVAATVVALSGAWPAAATTVRGALPAPNAAVVRVAPRAAPTLDLIEGRITAVDRVHRTLTVGNRTVSLHPTRLQVFGPDGRREAVASLAPGSRIRFALEPGAADPRPVVLIYVEAGR
jgi:hypothetical protein